MAHRTLVLVALLAACERPAVDQGATPTTPGAQAPVTEERAVTADAAASFDRQFIDHMAPHFKFGAELADVAEDRATHPELKTWAENQKKGYTTKVDQLKNWRNTWFQSADTPDYDEAPALTGVAPYTPGDWWQDDVKPGLGEKLRGKTTGMAWDPDEVVKALRDTDEPFDSEFIKAMMEHERHTIEAARAAQTSATHPELKVLAQQFLDDAQIEMKQLETWQTAWSGTPVPTERMHVRP